MLDLDRLFQQFPRLEFVDNLARHRRFHHWELAFADLFYADVPDGRVRGGFDLVLGNPPWVKVEWEERGVLGDRNPLFVLRSYPAATLTDMRDGAFEQYDGLRQSWMTELEQSEATQSFLNAKQNYPTLAGQQTNLYKCFLLQAWMIGGTGGVSGFLHPEDLYDDPKGGQLVAIPSKKHRDESAHRKAITTFSTIPRCQWTTFHVQTTSWHVARRNMNDARPGHPGLKMDEDVPRKVTEYYRVINRRMVASGLERTLITAVIQRDCAAIHTNVTTEFSHTGHCVDFAALTMSVVLDFFIKSTGTGEMNVSWLSRLLF